MSDFVAVLDSYVKANDGNYEVVADNLSVSIPTIARWLDKKNLPQRTIKEVLVNFMENELVQ